MNENTITALEVKEDVTLVTLYKIPNDMAIISDVFANVAKAEINVDMISQSAPFNEIVNLSFTIDDKDLPELLNVMSFFKDKIAGLITEVTASNAKIIVYGEKMREYCGVAADIFHAIASTNTEVIIITTSETDISILINSVDVHKVVEQLKKEFD